ncbi:MAG: DUF309 domain-containing protein [Desulfosarcina sp.]|jgi:hypothetical protein
MTDITRFDPFNNRLCRNVRNALSEGFKEALEAKDMQPVQRMAGFFLDDSTPSVVRAYIEKRLTAYAQVLAGIDDPCLEAPLEVAFRIWDQGLFFETHEYLEPFWMAAAGEEKNVLQAIIRSAGAYVHLEQGNLTGARRIADKALAVLERLQDRLAPYADPQLLLNKLTNLDPVPPTLSGTALQKNRKTNGR